MTFKEFFSPRWDQKSMKSYLPKKNKVKLQIEIMPYIYQILVSFVKQPRAYLNIFIDDSYTVSTWKIVKLLDIKQTKDNRMLILLNCPNL